MDPTNDEKGNIVSLTLGSGLLAASMLLGQPNEPATIQPTKGETIIWTQSTSAQPAAPQTQPQNQQQSRSIFGWFTREDRPILTKISGWFKRDPNENQPQPTQPMRSGVIRETPPPPMIDMTPVVPANDYPRRLPNPSSQATKPRETIVKDEPTNPGDIQKVSLQQSATPKSAKSPIRPVLADKIGRDEKFEWVTGQFEIENGAYVLYYATPETIDPYHGRLVLLPQQVEMKQFQRGDLVSVRGQLTQQKTTQGIAATYRVTSASLIERPKS